MLVAPIADARAAELALAFAALGDPVRLRLFSMIAAAGTACSCDLIEPLGKSQPTVSHHTRVLAEAGLIVGQKVGRWVNWTVVPEAVDQLRSALAASEHAPGASSPSTRRPAISGASQTARHVDATESRVTAAHDAAVGVLVRHTT